MASKSLAVEAEQSIQVTVAGLERVTKLNNPHKLTPDEEKAWRKLSKEDMTKADWFDLNATLIGFRRRYIQRHS